MQRIFQIKTISNCKVIEASYPTSGPGRTPLASQVGDAPFPLPCLLECGRLLTHSKMSQLMARSLPQHIQILECINLGSDYWEEDEGQRMERII